MILYHGSPQIVSEPRILKTYTLIDQMVFHTEAALNKLTFIEAKEARP